MAYIQKGLFYYWKFFCVKDLGTYFQVGLISINIIIFHFFSNNYFSFFGGGGGGFS